MCHSAVSGFPAAGTRLGCLLKTNLETSRSAVAVVLFNRQMRVLSGGYIHLKCKYKTSPPVYSLLAQSIFLSALDCM